MIDKELDRLKTTSDEVKNLTIRKLSHLWDKDDDERARLLFDGRLHELIKSTSVLEELPTLESIASTIEDALSTVESASYSLRHALRDIKK